MEIKIEDLILALRDLKVNIDESKNLVFNGKIVQAHRKLQGTQVKCDNILNYVISIAKENQPRP